jgi:hypothetical protein
MGSVRRVSACDDIRVKGQGMFGHYGQGQA